MKTICQWIGTSVPGILLSRGQTFGVALASSIDTYYFFFIFFCVYMFFVFMFFVVIINWCILFVCFTLALYEKTNESEVDVQHLTFIFSPSISLRFHQCVKQMTWSENKIKESLDFFTVLLLSNHKFIRAYIVSPTEKYEQGQTCKLSEIIFHPEISHSPCVVVFVWIVSLLALFKLWLGWSWPNQVTCILRCASYSCNVLWLLWKRLWHCTIG